jgi:hypothetical protein
LSYNPAYIQITTQLNQLEADEVALAQSERELRNRISNIESNALKGPRVEQELLALQRQMETAKQRYFAMRERQFGADIGQALESQNKGERFVLVEPPPLPLQPSSPNRPALLLLLLLLGPAAGVGIIQLKELIDDSVWTPKDIELTQGSEPIASIPLIMTADEISHRRKILRLAITGIPAAVVLMVVLIHFAVRPLDVLWYDGAHSQSTRTS